jgi:hypothetical protein
MPQPGKLDVMPKPIVAYVGQGVLARPVDDP